MALLNFPEGTLFNWLKLTPDKKMDEFLQNG